MNYGFDKACAWGISAFNVFDKLLATKKFIKYAGWKYRINFQGYF